ncbi:MAG TPA: hypothetical protein VII38_16940, partial [Polyangia bacterium]
MLAALSVLPGAGALTTGCGGGPPPYVDGGTPRALDVLSGAQIGRHYGETARLQVRYRLDDPAMTPLGSAQVRFAIFGDPGGSTLSTDRATTDGSGVASVSLTAGSEEASFKVEASADGAPDAEIDITVSKQDFVDLSVALAYDGPGTVQTFRALLYVGQPCRALVPKPVPDPAFRAFSVESGPAGTTGTIAFLSLLSRDYAVMGRAEDASGHLLAFGCADVGAGLLPPGTSATLPLPLDLVQASPLGSFELTSELPLAPEVVAPSVAPLSALAACAESPGQNLLDAIEPKLSSALATAIESHRGAVDAMGCRPPQLAGGAPSLDAQLEPLLTASGSPGAQLDAIALDLDHLAKSAELVSLLTITAAGAADFTAEHTLERLTLSTATGQMTYDLALAGLPIIDVRDLPLTLAGAQLTLGSHGFTLGLAPLFGRAFGDLALTPRGITP